MPVTIGTRLGSYDIVAPLGAGGMGEVYRAHDTKLNRDVAIKVLLPAVANDPDRLARFRREAQVLAALNHPNIAHIHGLEEAGGVTALVLELVEGEDLAQRIARGPLPLDEALPIAKQIAEALEAAHEQGIIHRDLKPANIKVRPDGTVKVLDFGLAKAIEGPGGSGIAGGAGGLENSPTLSIHATQAGVILGTAAYMSPEQARGRAVDRRADIWAVGCVLFEMLTGTRSFPGADATDTIVSVVSKEPDWKALPAAVPAGIRRLLRRSLEKDPKRRLDSAAAVRIDIDDALLASPADVNAVIASSPASPAVGRHGRERVAWGLVVLSTLAAVVIFVAYLRQGRSSDAIVRFGVASPPGVSRNPRQAFAISPDGRTLAFRAIGAGGVGRIYTRRLDEVDAQPVAGTENGNVPFWSPDSRSFGFMKEGGLYRTDLDGGAPRRLCDVAGGHAADTITVSSATWGTKGVIVFGSVGTGLWRVPETGGAPAPVTTVDTAQEETSHLSPWFLPDGRRLLFLAVPNDVVWAVSIDNPARTRVAESGGGAAYVDGWLLTTTAPPRGLTAQSFDPERLTLGGSPQAVRDRFQPTDSGGTPGFSVSLNGVLAVDRPPPVIHQLTWMDRVGRVLETIGPPAVIPDFSLASDDRRVAANLLDQNSLKYDLWLFDGRREEGTRLTFQGGLRRPMWALDGHRLYFTTAPTFEMRTLDAGASEMQSFESPGGFLHFEDATRDGRYLILKSRYMPLPAIWLQRVGVPNERRVLVQGQFGATQPRVSPDGRWLAYMLMLPRGPEVFVQPFDRPGERTQASRNGGSGPMWRADGRELYFEGTDALMAVTTTERGATLDVGAPLKLFPLHTQGLAQNQPHNVEVAANGQKFLVNTIVGDSYNVPIEVTLNWAAGLKK